jgi:hypothetical protein
MLVLVLVPMLVLVLVPMLVLVPVPVPGAVPGVVRAPRRIFGARGTEQRLHRST